MFLPLDVPMTFNATSSDRVSEESRVGIGVPDSLAGGADRDWFFKSANDMLDAVHFGTAEKIETVTATLSK